MGSLCGTAQFSNIASGPVDLTIRIATLRSLGVGHIPPSDRKRCSTIVWTHAQWWSGRCRTRTWVVRSKRMDNKQASYQNTQRATMVIIVDYMEKEMPLTLSWANDLQLSRWSRQQAPQHKGVADDLAPTAGSPIFQDCGCVSREQTVWSLRTCRGKHPALMHVLHALE